MKTIIDVSSVIYGGHHGAPDYRLHGFPIGGLRKVFGIINADFTHKDVILCFDGGATIKKQLLPTYKAGRVPDYSILAQIDFLKTLLLECNIPFYFKEGVEADDFICSLVRFFGMIKDTEDVEIFTDDHDLACCVSDRVKLRNVTSNGVCIDRRNYEDRVVEGERVPYNTILLHKLVHGDRSDNYRALKLPGVRFDMLAEFFASQLNPLIESGVLPDEAVLDYDVFTALVQALPENYTDETKKRLIEQGRIVYPLLQDVTENGMDAFIADRGISSEPLYKVEARHIKISSHTTINRKAFDFYCTAFGLNRCRPERQKEMYGSKYDEFVSLMQMMAKDLSNGTTAVKYNRRNRGGGTPTTTLQNMQLPL